MDTFDIFLVAPPGLEPYLLAEVTELGFPNPQAVAGGVEFQGTLDDVVRANRQVRGAARVLLRIASFRAMHLAQLDKRSRKVPWGDILRPDQPVHVEASCRKSRIYHNKAAAQRVANAVSETLGCAISAEAAVRLKVRIEDDLCTISVDTSGEALHKRGHKGAVGKAPIRENLAALCLLACDYAPGEPVVDPMCGSGTFPIEAAEIAAGLYPGRTRRFAFDDLAFAPGAIGTPDPIETRPLFFGFDRDQGGVKSAQANADQAGVGALTQFKCQPFSDLQPPSDQPGLVIINPPYGGRIGNKKQLYGLYGAMGQVLKDRFKGWRVGIVTSEPALANTMGLTWSEVIGPFPNGGIRVSLYRADIP